MPGRRGGGGAGHRARRGPRRGRSASASVSTPATAAAASSPTECPAVDVGRSRRRCPASAVERRGSAQAATRATMSGWATAVSRMVSASDVVPCATRSRPAASRQAASARRRRAARATGRACRGTGRPDQGRRRRAPVHCARLARAGTGPRRAPTSSDDACACPTKGCDRCDAGLGPPRGGRARARSAARTTRARRAGPSPSRRRPCAGGSARCWGARTACARPPRASGPCRGRPTSVSSSEPGSRRSGRYACATSVRRAVASPIEHPLGQQVVGQHGPRCLLPRAAPRRGPASAARAERAASARSGTTRPDHHRARARTGAAARRPRRAGRPRRRGTTTSRSPWIPTSASSAARRVARRRSAARTSSSVRRRGPDHDQRRSRGRSSRAPRRASAASRRTSPAHQRVDDERLEPRVPRAADLGGAGVDLGGGERDLARVAQHGLAQVALARRAPPAGRCASRRRRPRRARAGACAAGRWTG